MAHLYLRDRLLGSNKVGFTILVRCRGGKGVHTGMLSSPHLCDPKYMDVIWYKLLQLMRVLSCGATFPVPFSLRSSGSSRDEGRF